MAEAGVSSHTNYAHNECYADHMEYMIGNVVLENKNISVQEGSSCQEPFYIIWFKLLNSPYMMVILPTASCLPLFGY